MTPAETFTLLVAPAMILVLAVLVLLGFRIASRRFAIRERHLLDSIDSERDGGNGWRHTPRDRAGTTPERHPTERRSGNGSRPSPSSPSRRNT